MLVDRRTFLLLSAAFAGATQTLQAQSATQPLFTRNPWRTTKTKPLPSAAFYRPKGGTLKPIALNDLLALLGVRMAEVRNKTWQSNSSHGRGLGMLLGNELTNEEGYLWGKLARLGGVAHLELVHEKLLQANAQALESTLGYPAAPNHWSELSNCQTLVLMGQGLQNPYPLYALPDLPKKKALWIVTSEAKTPPLEAQVIRIKPNTELAFMGGWLRYLFAQRRWDDSFVSRATNGAYRLENLSFNDGLFSGYDPATRHYKVREWRYALESPTSGEPARAKESLSLGTVLQLTADIYAPYTTTTVSAITGVPKPLLEQFYQSVTDPLARPLGMAYSLDRQQPEALMEQWVRALAMVQLLTGQVGQPGMGLVHLAAGWNPQGLIDVGASGLYLPGYSGRVPQTSESYVSWFQTNGVRSFRRLEGVLSTWFGAQAADTFDLGFHWLPKAPSEPLRLSVAKGQTKLLFSLMSDPKALGWDLSRLDSLVLLTKDAQNQSLKDYKGELFILPIAANTARRGTITDLGRRILWQKASTSLSPGNDPLFLADRLWRNFVNALRETKAPDSDHLFNVRWPDSSPEQVLQEMTGFVPPIAAPAGVLKTETPAANPPKTSDTADAKPDPVTDQNTTADAKPNPVTDQNNSPVQDTTTGNSSKPPTLGVPVYEGLWVTENLSQKQNPDDPKGLGLYPGYGWSWPGNTRVLLNRASADLTGKPRQVNRPFIEWNDRTGQWQGPDVPDISLNAIPSSPEGSRAFRQTPEGVGRLITVEYASGLNLDTGIAFRRSSVPYLGPAPVFYWPWGTKLANPFYPKAATPPLQPS